MKKRRFKTKRAVMGSGTARFFHNWKKWEEGDYVIGKFVKTLIDGYDNQCPVIEVLEANFTNSVQNKDGEPVDIEGKLLQLNGNGGIKYAFYKEDLDNDKPKIEVGEIIQVTYNGLMPEEEWDEKGGQGQPPHQMDVQVLEEELEDFDDEETADDIL